MPSPRLFTPLKLRGLEIRNRIFVSPMCQYSSTDGLANEWHQVHLGSRARKRWKKNSEMNGPPGSGNWRKTASPR